MLLCRCSRFVVCWRLHLFRRGVAHAGDGDLDPTFSRDGIRTADLGFGGGSAHLVAGAGGSFFLAGTLFDGNGTDFALAEFKKSGVPELAFGAFGRREISNDPLPSRRSSCRTQRFRVVGWRCASRGIRGIEYVRSSASAATVSFAISIRPVRVSRMKKPTSFDPCANSA